jgi:formylglycine-generating enzyme required for sulfatase activity
MMKQKKRSTKKNKPLKPAHSQAPGNRRAAGTTKRKSIKIGIPVGIAAVLIIAGLIWISAGRKEEQARARSDESKTEMRQRLEEIPPAAGSALDFTESKYGIEMTHVRGGTLMIGCTPEQEGDCYDYEEPAHSVTPGDFYIGKYEVTQAQWKAVMENNPSDFKGDNLPVENVSWDDAQEFIRKLNAATGKTYRLPSEAEWEYAARGGDKSRAYKYSGSNDAKEVAWHYENSEGRTHPVGTKRANELGIHDMSGNVWEWVYDLYANDDSTEPANHESRNEGSFRVIRGGGWGSYARGIRVSNYYNNGSGNHYNILGFRLACD